MIAASGQFELDPESYDALVDWPKRLANEEPFYRRRFAEAGAQRVLDVACGTGHHVALFHSWGLHAEGADIDPPMIEFCRVQHGQSESLNWVIRSFTEPAAPPGTFDAAACVGNSLALVPDIETVAHVLKAMLASLRPGGVCIAQVVNLWRLTEGPTTWQKCQRRPRPDGDQILIKGMHRVGGCGHVDFIDIRLAGTQLRSATHAARFLGLRDTDLRSAALAGGADNVRFWGSYQETPYDPATSPDLILTCVRA